MSTTTDQIRSLAAAWYLPGTQQIDVSAWVSFAGQIRLNLELTPPAIHLESGGSTTTRSATDIELAAILAGLQALPMLRPLMTRREIMDLFTSTEKAAIRAASPELIEILLAATEPIAASVILPYFLQLQQAGVLTAERFTAITGEAV